MDQVFPNVPWQRCQFHFSRNISEKAPKKYRTDIRAEFHEMFNSEILEVALNKMQGLLGSYGEVAQFAMNCLEECFESAMPAMILQKGIRRHCGTSNHIERLSKELKHRSKALEGLLKIADEEHKFLVA